MHVSLHPILVKTECREWLRDKYSLEHCNDFNRSVQLSHRTNSCISSYTNCLLAMQCFCVVFYWIKKCDKKKSIHPYILAFSSTHPIQGCGETGV